MFRIRNLAVAGKVQIVVGCRGLNANMNCVELLCRKDSSCRCGTDSDVLDHIPKTGLTLHLCLQRESLKDAVADERADLFEILGTPCSLNFLERSLRTDKKSIDCKARIMNLNQLSAFLLFTIGLSLATAANRADNVLLLCLLRAEDDDDDDKNDQWNQDLWWKIDTGTAASAVASATGITPSGVPATESASSESATTTSPAAIILASPCPCPGSGGGQTAD